MARRKKGTSKSKRSINKAPEVQAHDPHEVVISESLITEPQPASFSTDHEHVVHRLSWARRWIVGTLRNKDQVPSTEEIDRNEKRRSVRQVLAEVKRYTEDRAEEFFGVWDYLIITLSVLSLLIIFAQLYPNISPEMIKLIQLFDLIICGIFLLDFSLRFTLARSKKAYLKWGWIDLISSLPMFDQLRVGRLFRLVRVVRAMRGALLGTKKLERKLQDPFVSVALISFICVFLGALSVLYLEAGVEGGNIKSARDAIWWALVTVTTVGYGDCTPVTNEGRFLAVILISAGIGLFGLFSVQCTQYLLREREKSEEETMERIEREIQQLRVDVSELKALLEKTTAPLASAQDVSKSDEAT